MGSLYVKGAKLWARYKVEHGAWKGAPTSYRPGDEANARRFVKTLEAARAARDPVARLRHSFASQLVSAGVPLRQVQDWLGHSTITMTMRYSHLAPGQGAELIRALENPSAVANTWQRR
jgi:integrase